MGNKKIIFASDHAGFELKQELINYLKSMNIKIVDLGPFDNKTPVSYAFYGKKLAQELLKNEDYVGVGICGTGLGISYALNRFKKIRAARVTEIEDAKLARAHNNANAIALSGRFVSFQKSKEILNAFLETKYEGGRHQKRIEELDL
ncbi:RpiB/LacA/LacB family sugar-phosphate isomerase [Mesomycoplasma neurolyticum]|uniref:Ribose-5-phosphate isomerase B n=1 Tax=Mesomycoplasma neurolyticum TaxID=2120 RepID=A0A449A618_9BACT|nr:RpiB/LacA/LacB family sugar-phosphate isomerase [Mesomycoplasma neurolyticum]VEU59669.1 ribose-5-phosphate isomerase B [Mesomycoplasma neurolyticum]